jgi:hypothetical protein
MQSSPDIERSALLDKVFHRATAISQIRFGSGEDYDWDAAERALQPCADHLWQVFGAAVGEAMGQLVLPDERNILLYGDTHGLPIVWISLGQILPYQPIYQPPGAMAEGQRGHWRRVLVLGAEDFGTRRLSSQSVPPLLSASPRY